MQRGSWKTRLGIYLAAIGSAFGLGCLWRFPYVVAENGGGAFILLYLFMFILIGVPMLIGELLIGKVTRRSVIAAQKQLVAQSLAKNETSRNWSLKLLSPVGILCVITCLVILSYYSVVSGWVLYFLGQFAVLLFTEGGSSEIVYSLEKLNASGYLQFTMTAIHIIAVLVIVAKEVEEGIERWVGFIIPIFVAIMAVLISQTLWSESNYDVWRTYFYPDLSRLTLNSLGAAVGHVCFTLSIGFGTMITFGSYLKDDAAVPATGFRVSAIDCLSAILSGLLIFPLVGSAINDSPGPEILFRTVPTYLLDFQNGKIYGLFFFICLYLAALGASISLLETVVANITENTRLKRSGATLGAGLISLLCALPAALSSTYFSDFQWGEKGYFKSSKGLLVSIDHILIDWLVPVLALFFCFVVVRRVSSKWKRDEFLTDENDHYGEILFSHWKLLMKWVVPFVIVLGLALQIVGL